MSIKDYHYIHGESDDAPVFHSDGRSAFIEFSRDYSHAKDAGFICTSEIRAEVLFLHQGRCYICGVEEWKTRKRLHMHRVIKGTSGGTYAVENVAALCSMCHYHAEGKRWEEINQMRAKGGVK